MTNNDGSDAHGLPERLLRWLAGEVGNHIDAQGFTFAMGKRVTVTVLPKP
jgi:hypothetical protein